MVGAVSAKIAFDAAKVPQIANAQALVEILEAKQRTEVARSWDIVVKGYTL
jgi:hypothetical protein